MYVWNVLASSSSSSSTSRKNNAHLLCCPGWPSSSWSVSFFPLSRFPDWMIVPRQEEAKLLSAWEAYNMVFHFQSKNCLPYRPTGRFRSNPCDPWRSGFAWGHDSHRNSSWTFSVLVHPLPSHSPPASSFWPPLPVLQLSGRSIRSCQWHLQKKNERGNKNKGDKKILFCFPCHESFALTDDIVQFVVSDVTDFRVVRVADFRNSPCVRYLLDLGPSIGL